jgi:hypothetical protein
MKPLEPAKSWDTLDPNPGLGIAAITLWELALLVERSLVVVRGVRGTEAARAFRKDPADVSSRERPLPRASRW